MSMRAAATALAAILLTTGGAMADDFGTGENQFTIDFVTISGDASIANGTNISQFSPGHSGYKTFTDPVSDYRMGTYEITNSQWDKFKASLGVPVTGDPSSAYDESPYYHTGANVPTNMVSWYEAAQFVNWLNTSTGHQAAYKFTGTQGTSGYALETWPAAEADGGTNLYRHKDAMYYMPTDDEWVKAAYWNGTGLQTYATKLGDTLHQGDGMSGSGWNYYDDDGFATDPGGPWDVGSGSEELNGTFDMMGNILEWLESPWTSGDYGTGSIRGKRGGSYYYDRYYHLTSTKRFLQDPYDEPMHAGFRVASKVPEPALSVEIDIEPGNDHNPINPKSRGVTTVAILTTDEFDATTVDPETVGLAGAPVAVRGKGELLAKEEDVDDDGDIDLVVKVETESMTLEEGATTATLTGETFDGAAIEGTDDIVIVGK